MKRDRTILLSSLLIPFGIYLRTVAHTVSFFDSGEFISSAATLGISHPPGYPLYVLIGHAFSYLPLGNIAYRINIVSSFFGALSVMMIYLVTLKVMEGIFTGGYDKLKIRLTALSASLMFAFSLNQWGQTNMSEVYALNTFFVALLIFILLCWRGRIQVREGISNSSDSRLIYIFAFLFGLGFGDHHTILVVVPVAMVVIIFTRWRLLIDPKRLALLFFFFLLGFSVYLYMPVRATSDLVMNWGNPETLKQFRWMFFREGYPKGEVYRDLQLLMDQLKTINFLYEFTLAGFIIGVVGFLGFIKKEWFYAAITIIVTIVLSVGIIIYGNPPKENIFLTEAFHTPTYMVFTPWIAVGIFWLLSMLTSLAGRYTGSVAVGRLVTMLWIAVLVAAPSSLFYAHLRQNDRSRNFIAFDYAVNSLKSLSSNGILFTWGDSGAFPLWYMHHVEKYNPGVLLLHTPHLASDWYVDDIPDLRNSRIRRVQARHRSPSMVVEYITRENKGFRRTYIDYSSKYSFPIRNLDFVPHGIVYKNEQKGAKVDNSIWDLYVARELLSDKILKDLDIGKAISIYGFCRYDAGTALLKEGRRAEAVEQFSEAIKIVPGLRGKAQRALFPEDSHRAR